MCLVNIYRKNKAYHVYKVKITGHAKYIHNISKTWFEFKFALGLF